MDIVLYSQCFLYLGAGVSHFVMPRFFESIVPAWLPSPKLVNIAAGIAEIGLALGLWLPATRQMTAWLVIIFLIAVFPANVKQINQRALPWLGWVIRLPIQLLLIYVAFLLTR